MKVINKLGVIVIIMMNISCGSRSNHKIATIKNYSSSVIACAILNHEIIVDSLLFKDTSFMKYVIQPLQYDTYMVDSNLMKAPDSAKKYIYILNLDSLKKFRNSASKKQILKHSLVKTIIVQLNKITEPVDTVYVR